MFINQKHESADKELKAGNVEVAIAIYTELIQQYEHPDLYSDRGVAFLHLKNAEACFSDLNQAIELQPDYAFRYACRAYAKNNFGDLDGAIEDYNKAIELDPNDAVAHNNLGMLLEQKGYQSEAQQRFDLADKLSKMEDHFFKVMDQMEQDPKINEKQKPDDATKKSTEEINPDASKGGTLHEMKKTLTSRKQFREFLAFVKNGFRLK